MEEFIAGNLVLPFYYCSDRIFTSCIFTSDRGGGLRLCYHTFKTNNLQERKGTAILSHGYSSHSLAEFLNLELNNKEKDSENSQIKKINSINNEKNKQKQIKDDLSMNKISLPINPLNNCKYATTYKNSYIEQLNLNGYDVIMLDIEGHGFSQGVRYNIENLDNCSYSIIQMLQMEIIRYNNLDSNLESTSENYDKFDIVSFTWNTNTNDTNNLYKGEYISNLTNMTNSKNYIPLNNRICCHCNSRNCLIERTFGEEFILCGISMGGALVLRIFEIIGETLGESSSSFLSCFSSRICCGILLSPMLSLEKVQKKFSNRLLLPLLPLASYFLPNLQVGSHNSNPVCEHIFSFSRDDPLTYNKRVKALMCRTLLEFVKLVKAKLCFYPLHIPLLICHCVHDSLTDFDGSRNTINTLQSMYKEYTDENFSNNRGLSMNDIKIQKSNFALWPITSNNMWHVLTREVGYFDLLQDILSWITSKSTRSNTRLNKLNIDNTNNICDSLYNTPSTGITSD
ncbi:uncharacterized protein CMU_020670 [Cryptosporidium muris RN66]|uniref:Serine aminopeptidase S33 domain-containing protein n=1 Tax=Cryptosporidium muris (strain RN66) TaxID=441375 RepID=B6AJ86_CRYMR|nr:uncharacterized protein CMU_020670 [Cryptosporidium muris RN66]EEA08323.1 hypothetical protein, conserved [Cryptosporidium muris RN66]|eukprot:XP_002142672.1 hypothetical protein [Cryptosporidium muris RN66]